MNDIKEGKLRKKCPFLNEWCIGDACACYIQIAQTQVNQLGIRQQVQTGMCSLLALCMIMSSNVQQLLQQKATQVRLTPPFNRG